METAEEPAPGRRVPAGPRRRLRGRLLARHLVPAAVALGALLALVLSVHPASLAAALRSFDLRLAPALVGLSLGYYVLQGVRWRALLRIENVDIAPGDCILLTLAGQSTALLPLGELTRAVFVSEATGASFGAVSAALTVQELTYSGILIAVAIPGAIGQLVALAGVVLALIGTVLSVAILTVPALFRRVMSGVRRVPGLRGFEPAIRSLQLATVDLLRHRATYRTLTIAVVQVAMAVTLFWTAAQGIRGGVVSWPAAAFAYAVINVASAISLSPGGLGAFELGGAGLLVSVGVPYDVAAATAIIHRAADKGVATVVGFGAYLLARRRWRLGSVSLLSLGSEEALVAREAG